MTGHVGNALALFLLSKGHSVIGVSRSEKLIEHSSYKHILVDLSSEDFGKSLPENIEVVYHLAQSKQYRDFITGAEDMFSVNIRSTFLLLEWGKRIGIKKFIFSSTGNVYLSSNNALSEDALCQPDSFYGVSKLAAEQMVMQYRSLFNVFVCRVFGVYGPGQKNMLVSNLIKNVREQKEITLAGNVGLYMNPLYIDDCVELFEQLLTKDESGVINFAAPETTDISSIVSIIENATGKTVKKNITKDVPKYLIGDTSKMNKFFGKRSYTSIKEGLNKTLKAEGKNK